MSVVKNEKMLRPVQTPFVPPPPREVLSNHSRHRHGCQPTSAT